MLSPQWLDQLRSRTSLSALIGRTTRLQKVGREYKACCPFHEEKTPSFHVNDEKGFYHCFGCGAHGDAIKWMTDHQGLPFMDAVKDLAAEAGMDVPAPDPRAAKAAEKRDTLYDVMAAAQAWFVANLAGPEGAEARAYLATRGFDAHTVQRFGFGYAPEGRQALKAALGQFPETMLIEAGLRIVVHGKDPYDRFRGRLMLPIEDTRGRAIAFGGRILAKGKTDAPKYLNSPDTPLFDKGRNLYNLHRAAPAARQSGRLIVVEGYMDVIALAAAGIAECVAPMGTALTEQQLELLWRQVENPVLCFDGDTAGQRAAMRAITRALPMLRPAHSLRIVRLPEGLDPDDLLKSKGRSAMDALLDAASPLVDVLWEAEREFSGLGTPEAKAGFKARLVAHTEAIQDKDVASLYRRDLLDRFFRLAYPKREFGLNSSNVVQFEPHRQFREHLSYNKKEQRRLHERLGAAIAASLISYPDQVHDHAEALCDTPDLDPRINAILDVEDRLRDFSKDDLEAFISSRGLNLPTSAEWDDLRFSFTWPPADRAEAIQSLKKAVNLYSILPAARDELNLAAARYQSDVTEENRIAQQRLLDRVMAMERELQKFAIRLAAGS